MVGWSYQERLHRRVGVFLSPERQYRSGEVERECSSQGNPSENHSGGGCGYGVCPGDGKDILLQTNHSQREVQSAAVGQSHGL